MKSIFLLVSLFLSISTFDARGQGEESGSGSLLVLDNYTVPMNMKGAKVGKFIIPDRTTQLTLIKDDSDLFEIKNGDELYLRKNKQVDHLSPISFEIVVKSGDKHKSFEIVKDEFIKNKVIAHRGGWKHSDTSQNTLGALKHAIELGCEGSELDVWLTKDNVVVLNHDIDLEGRIIEKTSSADLKMIKLKNGETTPTLEEYIKLIKTQNKTRLVIELKSDKSNAKIFALADSVINIVHRMNAQAWVDYISFDYRGLKVIRQKDAAAHIAFLEPSVDLDLQAIDGISGIDYHYSSFDQIEKLYERCRKLGLTINVWTVNDRDRMKKFLDLGVDFITTDEPEILLKLIEEQK